MGKKVPYTERKTEFSSRDKGLRVERLCMQELKSVGWKVDRVPLSGAMVGFPGDIWANHEKYGKVILEVKGRKSEFNTLYLFYEKHRNYDYPFLVVQGTEYTIVITHVFNELFTLTEEMIERHRMTPKETNKTNMNKFERMQKWLKGAHFLAARGDRRPFIFMKFIPIPGGTAVKEEPVYIAPSPNADEPAFTV